MKAIQEGNLAKTWGQEKRTLPDFTFFSPHFSARPTMKSGTAKTIPTKNRRGPLGELAGRVRRFDRPLAARLPIFAVPNFGTHASLGTANFATAAASSLHSHVSTPTVL
jgi:hypothetical protein